MAIRPRISDPYGAEAKEFARMRREGPLPKTPDRKPPAAEREPLLEALQRVPVGKTFTIHEWSRKYATYLTTRFTLWGIEFAVYPMARTEANDIKICTGVFIQAITRNRRNTQPMKSFKGPYMRSWYRELLDWLEDNFFGG